MPISPAEAERLAEGIRATFENLEGIILERIARRLKRDINSPNWQDIKLGEVRLLQQEIDRLVREFTISMTPFIEDILRSAFELGLSSAEKDAVAAGVLIGGTTTVASATTTGASTAVNTLALGALIAEATGAVNGMRFNILRKSEDIYRKVIINTSASVIAGTETKLQAVQRSINEFADAGVSGFVDRAGRNWNIGSYSDMAVRTAVGRAAMAGHELRLTELGEDLVIVSQHPDECPLCRAHEGKIYSISGVSEKYPPLARAKAAGLFHPNCAHVATAYFEGYTSPMPEKIGKPTDYEEKQRQRALERRIRKYKMREAAAITPAAKKEAAAKVKAAQADMRKFIEDTGRRRKYEREQVNFSAARNPTQFTTKEVQGL